MQLAACCCSGDLAARPWGQPFGELVFVATRASPELPAARTPPLRLLLSACSNFIVPASSNQSHSPGARHICPPFPQLSQRRRRMLSSFDNTRRRSQHRLSPFPAAPNRQTHLFSPIAFDSSLLTTFVVAVSQPPALLKTFVSIAAGALQTAPTIGFNNPFGALSHPKSECVDAADQVPETSGFGAFARLNLCPVGGGGLCRS